MKKSIALLIMVIGFFLLACSKKEKAKENQINSVPLKVPSKFEARVQELRLGGLKELDTANYAPPSGFKNLKRFAVFQDPSNPKNAIIVVDTTGE